MLACRSTALDRFAADCHRAEAAGCAGVGLLAHRAIEADPLDMVRAAITGRLVVAGSQPAPVVAAATV
ncbi:hypothetical protein GR925_17865 [Streptomyces sp. HUCO-GS316]|uniref:hypothetical protein n=1 Tax=Streptomyces sp. HUCO-GS316 TaxID=2692198 RepID=UPI00140104AE|nr:hypothetical protein [Streptomyces sp. HUCO-GS316]MXM65261.1 hypothetical protein [Streptomyces sp. HUCO-GS316]